MDANLIKVRQLLKERLKRDYTALKNYEVERKNVMQVIQRAVEFGESNSLLLIGPRGCGKSTLINAVLAELLKTANFRNNCIVVCLNGNLHTDDKLALRSATVQMQLENVADGKVFGSFAENLEFLLACLKSGDKRSKSVIFILKEFDLFCSHHNQTLLYNLFDISQSSQAPICVLGSTCRLDVVELLEKRVKSRFSHRQIFLISNPFTFDEFLIRIEELLTVPNEEERKILSENISHLQLFESKDITFQHNHFDPIKYKIDEKFVHKWNTDLHAMIKDCKNSMKNALRVLYELDTSESFLKTFIFRLVAQLNSTSQPRITEEQITEVASEYLIDSKVQLICGLSVLELCILIAIKHHCEIYDRDPFNFQIIYTRFEKFTKISSSMNGVERSVALKAFERLCNTEMILPVFNNCTKIQKDFEMYRLALTYSQITTAIQKYCALPTEVMQWSQNSLV